MPGIQTFTSSPINPNAAKPQGTTPSTASPLNPHTESTPASVPATTTSYTTLGTSAQPATPAYPAPTSSARTTYTPTSTQPVPSQTSDTPAPPQPGAVPTPFQSTQRSTVPPPPRAGEIPKPAAYYAPQQTQSYKPPTEDPVPLPPHQAQPNLFTPSRAQPPASSTTYSDLSSPPGYHQNTSASFEERPLEPYRPFDNLTGTNPNSSSPSRLGGGGLGGYNDGGGSVMGGEEEKSIWDTAVSWAKAAGDKLAEGEEQVWKMVNREK